MTTHAYIGIKACGCVQAVVVDDPKYPKDTARSVSDFIKDGLTVERVTMAVMREKLKTKCQHEQKPVSDAR